jgi:hypothetical protein
MVLGRLPRPEEVFGLCRGPSRRCMRGGQASCWSARVLSTFSARRTLRVPVAQDLAAVQREGRRRTVKQAGTKATVQIPEDLRHINAHHDSHPLIHTQQPIHIHTKQAFSEVRKQSRDAVGGMFPRLYPHVRGGDSAVGASASQASQSAGLAGLDGLVRGRLFKGELAVGAVAVG